MAKLLNGIFGGFSGKLGSLIGSSWKKTAVVRKEQAKSSKPRSKATQDAIDKFRYMAKWLVPFYPYVTQGFKFFAETRTEINAAFSYNYKNSLRGEAPNFTIDYAFVMVSRGQLTNLLNVKAVLQDKNMLLLSWSIELKGKAYYNDQVMLVIYCPEIKDATGMIGGINRSDGQLAFKLNEKFHGKALEVYVSTYTINNKIVSDSAYLGRIEPAI